MDIEARVEAYIRAYGMISRGDTVIAGVSGGADSMCMLQLLLNLKARFEYDIVVVHINHGIRGKSADRDERFVEDFCKKNKTEFISVHGDIPAILREQKITCEEAGRNFRYNTFTEIALKYKNAKVAVAHNSDDNAETVLFNIFRGSGITGICGIRPIKNRNTVHGNITVIRPVLCLKRNEIEAYLETREISFCVDETNLTNDYSRNCIRNVLLPKAKEMLNGNITEHIMTLSERAGEIDDYINLETESFFRENVECVSENGHVHTIKVLSEKIENIHPAIRGMVIRKMIEALSGSLKDVESIHTQLLVGLCEMSTGKSLDLPYDIRAIKEYDKLVLRKQFVCRNSEDTRIHTEVRAYEGGIKIPTSDDEKWFDYDEINEEPVVRYRRDGDYLLIGKECHKKSLNRFFIDQKVPEAERDGIELLAEGNHVLYVAGLRRDDSCKVTEDTKRILVVKYKK